MALRRHVHPDLVRAARFELDLEEARVGERLERRVMRHRRLAVARDRELPVVPGMAADRPLDRARERIRVPLHDRVVDLVDLALLERALQLAVGPLALRDDHEPARAGVEPVHDALALRRSRGRDPVPGPGERAEHGRPLPPERRMGGDAGGLVDHDDVVVVVHDAELGQVHGDDLGAALLLPGDLEPAPGREPIGLAEHSPVERDSPARGDVGREAAREAEELRERRVHALAREPVGHGKATVLHARPSRRSRDRRPDRRRRRDRLPDRHPSQKPDPDPDRDPPPRPRAAAGRPRSGARAA